jgi:hypothetical protein
MNRETNVPAVTQYLQDVIQKSNHVRRVVTEKREYWQDAADEVDDVITGAFSPLEIPVCHKDVVVAALKDAFDELKAARLMPKGDQKLKDIRRFINELDKSSTDPRIRIIMDASVSNSLGVLSMYSQLLDKAEKSIGVADEHIIAQAAEELSGNLLMPLFPRDVEQVVQGKWMQFDFASSRLEKWQMNEERPEYIPAAEFESLLEEARKLDKSARYIFNNMKKVRKASLEKAEDLPTIDEDFARNWAKQREAFVLKLKDTVSRHYTITGQEYGAAAEAAVSQSQRAGDEVAVVNAAIEILQEVKRLRKSPSLPDFN